MVAADDEGDVLSAGGLWFLLQSVSGPGCRNSPLLTQKNCKERIKTLGKKQKLSLVKLE